MSNAGKLSALTRQELYDLIWLRPATKLAAEFGISDVALAKRCKKHSVPKPSLGYWAKVAAGESPPKKPLPPPPDEVFIQAAKKQTVGKALSLPSNSESLHPLAAELMRALLKARVDHYKRADLRVPSLPELNISKALGDRVARAFHVILNGVEPLGIYYRKSQSSYSDGFFLRRHDRLYLRVEETLVEADGSTRRRPGWDSQGYRSRPSGHLCFVLKNTRYGANNENEWIETPKLSLERVLAQIVAFIKKYYLEAHNKRVLEAIETKKRYIEWERRQKVWEAEEAIRRQQERERKHAEALASAKQARVNDLLKAAEWWRITQFVLQFINECEQRWQNPTGALTAEQSNWLIWARQYAGTISPFETGYPDPARDGKFDVESIPMGGSYPVTRDFPQPPTMPKQPSAPV